MKKSSNYNHLLNTIAKFLSWICSIGSYQDTREWQFALLQREGICLQEKLSPCNGPQSQHTADLGVKPFSADSKNFGSLWIDQCVD